MKLVPSRSLAAAAAAILALSVAACSSQQGDADLSTRDGNSDGKALTAPTAAAPTLRGLMPVKGSMKLKSNVSVGAPTGAKLAYFGGNVIEHPTYTNIFWGAYWTNGAGLAERQHMNQFAQAVLPMPEFLSAIIEYTGKNGVKINTGTFSGEKVISGEPGGASKTITNDQIRTTIDSWIQAGLVAAPTINTLYTLHFPPGVSITMGTDGSCTTFCGYHNTVQTTRGTGGLIRYIVLPYPNCQGCNFESTAQDSLTVVYSHEAWEADTDADVGIAIDTNVDSWLGWYDNANGENADICAGDPNAVLAGFKVQTTWSNAENKCVSQRNVGGTPGADFTLAAAPATQTINAGDSASYDLMVTGANGFSGPVTFTLGGASASVTGTFSGSVSGTGKATLNVATTAAASGPSTLVITATSGSLSHSATVTLTANQITVPDFAVSATPTNLAVTAGGTATATVSITDFGGFAKPVTMSTSNLPSGVTATYSAPTIAGAGSATLTFSAAASAPASQTDVAVSGTVGTVTHTATVHLVVTASAQADFTVVVSPAAATVTAGDSTSGTVTVGASAGFTSAVTLATSGAPAGVTVSLDHASITGSGSAGLSIATTAAAAAGTYAIAISGTSGSLRHSAAFSLTVKAKPSTGGVAFSDDAESGMGQWTTYAQNSSDPKWGIESSSAAHGGTHRFRSNIGRNYANNTATFMISKAFSLAGASKATLSFFYKYSTEDSFDSFYVWASKDDGQSWTNIATGTGTSPGWNRWAPQASIDLSAFAGNSKVRIAFSLQSDYSVTDWGVGLDDIQVTTPQ